MRFKAVFPILLLLVIFVNRSAFAKKGKKDELFKKGQINVQVGASFISAIKIKSTPDYNYFGTITKSFPFPIELRADYGLTDEISAGIFISKSSTKITVTDVTVAGNIYGFTSSLLTIGARGTYHYKLSIKKLKLDPYAYAMLGFTSIKSTLFGSNNYLEPKKAGLAYSIGVGANYMLSKNAGAYLEVGYGISTISIGAVGKF